MKWVKFGVSGHFLEYAWREWPEILHAAVSLVKWVKFGVSGHFSRNTWSEWPENLHADLSWPPSELIGLGSWSVDLSNFGAILTYWNGSNLGVPGISWRTHWGNGLAFCMPMYLEHLQNWVDYGHSLLIFSNFGTNLSSWNGINLGILVMLWGFSSLWCPFYWNWSYLGFLGIIWRTCGNKCRGESGGIFPTLCVEFRLVSL